MDFKPGYSVVVRCVSMPPGSPNGRSGEPEGYSTASPITVEITNATTMPSFAEIGTTEFSEASEPMEQAHPEAGPSEPAVEFAGHVQLSFFVWLRLTNFNRFWPRNASISKSGAATRLCLFLCAGRAPPGEMFIHSGPVRAKCSGEEQLFCG